MLRTLLAGLLALALASCASNPSGDMGTAMGRVAADLLRHH